jgi:predicted ATPase
LANAPSPIPAHQTGRADFRHPAFRLASPRPPALMILNEPETSLHPDLLPPLARLIAQASKRSQAVVVSHAATLVAALAARADCRQIVLEKQLGETIVRDGTPPDWTWPSR